MATFLEQPFYYSNEPKMEDDFYLIQDVSPFLTNLSHTTDKSTLISQMRQQMFNTTSACFPSPENIIMGIAQNRNLSHPCSSSDPLAYRQHRSEQLLFRMLCCNKMDLGQLSLMRLSKGVFVHQVWQPSSPQSSPTLSTIESTLYQTIDLNGVAPVDDFDFGNIHQRQHSYDMFVPFSYTFGARYTNPYSDMHDLIVRGKLPVWCQTLFLSTCMKAHIQPNVPILGLFPFAPHIPVTFKPIQYTSVIPDLTLLYERLTMEFDDPYSLPDGLDDSNWPECKQQVLANILICDIPDNVANVLENMANLWATSQGLFF